MKEDKQAQGKSELAKRLIQFRKQLNFTQERLADTLGIKRATYAYYERTTVPPQEILEKLANIFRVSMDELVGRTGKEYKTVPVTNTVLFQSNEFSAYRFNPQFNELSDDERIIIAQYRTLSAEQKRELLDHIKDNADV